ncbi:poly [ADP-ribose] polymerase 2 isoform X2 [Hypomesus transpacificus]|uniref:poly [ADP-ribose] polymerase 2 isoform X2 n=1 Tax=Hypomesus transpacificus TaxID=137520 RepID=UPI001F07E3D8|nr:poly [ADP-ribose] polymerase 2 isoform X2 [Hypomesus transpacificus]
MRRTRSSKNTSQVKAEREEVQSNVWQWEGDDGQWQPYPASACALLDSAVSSGGVSVSLALGSASAYEVDLKKMVQVNPVTKYRRKIRTYTVKPEAANGSGDAIDVTSADASTVEVKNEEEKDEPPSAKKKRSEGRSQKKSKATPVDDMESKEVVKTVVMKGKAPVDPECKAKVGKAHVYSAGNDVYDVMLNQTNLQFNNNKYYLMQLLQDDHAKAYSVWLRWGRVGKAGQSNLISCGGDLLQAKDVFNKKFFDKTKNEWGHRANFEKVAGKYDMVFMDYSINDKEETLVKPEASAQKKTSQLDVKIQSLLELICDIKAMEECVLEMKFDTRKAPLGKLTVEQIRAGYAALKKIEECVKRKGSSRELLEACNQFYTRIPHDFGLKTPPIIRTEDELKQKIALLEALGDIQIAVKMVQSSSNSDEHPLDRQYHSLNCQLQLLAPTSHEYQVIERYLQTTHAPTHSDYTMSVLDMFSVDREGEKDSFLSQIHNRTLLWHGSRLSNWFGKGIYFADMSSKSANYCFASQQNSTGLLLLCEVALGDSNELLDADYEAEQLPAGKHSTKGLGQTGPSPDNSLTLDGMTVPMGPSKKTGVGEKGGYSLLYNEFIVYNPAQTRMRYLLRVRFNYSSLW